MIEELPRVAPVEAQFAAQKAMSYPTQVAAKYAAWGDTQNVTWRTTRDTADVLEEVARALKELP